MRVTVTNSNRQWAICEYTGLPVPISQIIPRLSFLAILGLYSLYLLWLGLPVLMKSPADRATGYTAAVVVIMFVIMFVVMLILGMVFVI